MATRRHNKRRNTRSRRATRRVRFGKICPMCKSRKYYGRGRRRSMRGG